MLDLFRRESKKNFDRFTAKRAPKAQSPWGVWGHRPPGYFFFTLSALSWLLESVRQYICHFHSPWVKPCKSANYFVKVNVHVVMNVQQGKSVNFLCDVLRKYVFSRQNVPPERVYDPCLFPVIGKKEFFY